MRRRFVDIEIISTSGYADLNPWQNGAAMVARSVASFVCIVALLIGLTTSVEADVGLLGIRFYGSGPGEGHIYVNDKKIFVRDWQPFEFHEYAPLDGVRPTIVDVVVSVLNSADATEETDIRMVVSPKVAPIVFIPGLTGSGIDPSTADPKATRLGAYWFAPIRIVTKTVTLPSRRPQNVSFHGLNLADMLDQYAQRRLWPVDLRFDVSVEPTRQDRRLQNNTMSRSLRINLPHY
jgi:hypothetical protein